MSVLFVSPALFGGFPAAVAILAVPPYSPGEIMAITDYECDGVPGTTTTTEATYPVVLTITADNADGTLAGYAVVDGEEYTISDTPTSWQETIYFPDGTYSLNALAVDMYILGVLVNPEYFRVQIDGGAYTFIGFFEFTVNGAQVNINIDMSDTDYDI